MVGFQAKSEHSRLFSSDHHLISFKDKRCKFLFSAWDQSHQYVQNSEPAFLQWISKVSLNHMASYCLSVISQNLILKIRARPSLQIFITLSGQCSYFVACGHNLILKHISLFMEVTGIM